MQEDFHYYCMAVVARAAGLTPQDALTLAYASQYVDDATESKPLRIEGLFFDPTRTRYFGLKTFNWSIQKKVYIPFHFLPPTPIRSKDDLFVVKSDSDFSKILIKEAFKEPDDKLRLYRLAVAFHTYADTYAHQDFSGRRHRENLVRNIEIYQDGQWKGLGFKRAFYRFGPFIGHAEAGSLPDISYLRWRYKQRLTGNEIERDNPTFFMECAYNIYKMLRSKWKGEKIKKIAWKKIESDMLSCFSLVGSEKLRDTKWQDTFSSLFPNHKYKYNKYRWRKHALGVKKSQTKWDKKDPVQFFGSHVFPKTADFYESDWVLFHRAALRQRHLVIEHLL